MCFNQDILLHCFEGNMNYMHRHIWMKVTFCVLLDYFMV